MRVMVFFDLPTLTSLDKKNYSLFRKFLINEGFIMMQESVYSKIALNATISSLIQDKVRKNKPPKGLIQMLVITENQYSKIEFVIGQGQNKIVDGTNRMVIL